MSQRRCATCGKAWTNQVPWFTTRYITQGMPEEDIVHFCSHACGMGWFTTMALRWVT